MREGQHETTPHSMHLRVRDVTFVRARSRCEVDGPPEAPAGGPEIDCLVGSTPPLPPHHPFPHVPFVKRRPTITRWSLRAATLFAEGA